MKLHLGETDIPYQEDSATTGDVAEILERKYHIFQSFVALHGSEIAEAMGEAMQDSLENVLMGAPPVGNPLLAAESRIETLFRDMLSNRELERLGIPGVPTKAALEGRSKRFKRRKGPPRPSFIDSGQMQAAMKVWSET